MSVTVKQSDWRDPQNGFTLIEMLVVVAIIIVASAFLTPSLLSYYNNRKLNNAGDLIQGALLEARNNAITQREPWSVIFVKRGTYLYEHGTAGRPGKVAGTLERYEPDEESEIIRYDLFFASEEEAGIPYEDLPAGVDLAEGQELASSDVIYLRCLPDGQIQFPVGKNISSLHFNQGTKADIVITQEGRYAKGLIEISPSGSVRFKIVETQPDEAQ